MLVPSSNTLVVIACWFGCSLMVTLLESVPLEQYPTGLSSTEFGSVTILRALIMKYQNPDGWKKLMTLEHHNEIRKMLPLWRENEMSVVEVLFDNMGLEKFFTNEEVHSVCGIFEVNAFELGEKCSFRGVFPEAAMMAHDCIPNATHFENPIDGIIEVRAAVDIPVGTPITVCYAYALEATSQRRRMLMETKFFECVCKRWLANLFMINDYELTQLIEGLNVVTIIVRNYLNLQEVYIALLDINDSKELNTNMGTLVCQACKVGHVINTGAEEVSQMWACDRCGSRMPLASLESTIQKWQLYIEHVDNIKDNEKALSSCKSIFHPTHFIPFGIKFNLCQAYGREEVPLMELSQPELDRKLELCREVMEILDIITPGYTITRGLVLYELQAAETIHTRRFYESRKLSKTLLKRRLQNTLKILTESIEILKLSHVSTSEFRMAQDAERETVVELTRWINSLK